MEIEIRLYKATLSEMNLAVQSLIVEIRALRKEIGVDEKAVVPIQLRVNPALLVDADAGVESIIRKNRAIVERLARVGEIHFVEEIQTELARRSTPNFDVAVVFERTIDLVAERERLTKEIAKYEKGLISAERQLGNEGFLAKAPAKVVEGLKKQEAETRLLLDKARAALDALPKE
jgi:valyl-tRNA synthetase